MFYFLIVSNFKMGRMWKLLFFILICGYVHAMTDGEAKMKFVKHLLDCTKDHPLPMTEIIKLQNQMVPTKTDAKCLLACTYKSLGTMDSQGMYDIKKGYEFAEKMREGDDKRVENGKKLADICAEVNKQTVSDGEKGCERAALMFKCVIDNAPKLGFEIK